MSKIPLDIHHFPDLIRDGSTYVDKTHLIYQFIKMRPGCFIARPRRFGKSLLVSTLESLFKGERELFKGLWIDSSDYDWQEHPIIRIDWTSAEVSTKEALADSIMSILKSTAEQYGIEDIDRKYPILTFTALVKKLHQKIGRTVVLIDEYDQPLNEHIENPKKAQAVRDYLRRFYTNMKSQERYLRFIFVTGVSQFTKVSLFSGLNNLNMLSFDSDFADLLGLTEEEIKDNFSDQIARVAEIRGETEGQVLHLLKTWYNGYLYANSNDAPRVYNPVSVFSFLKDAVLDNYWFATGTPTMAIKLAQKNKFPLLSLEKDIEIGKKLELAHAVGKVDLPILLYQTGYLTIRKYDKKMGIYLLNFPNEEVRRSFLEHLAHEFFQSNDQSDVQVVFYKLANCLNRHHLHEFFEIFKEVLDSIPNQIHKDAEGYYHSLLYLFLKTLGFRVDAEVSTAKGRIDMILKTATDIFIFEFKINKSADDALKQIHEKAYYTQFKSDKRPITLLGVNFDTKLRTITDWKQEKLP